MLFAALSDDDVIAPDVAVPFLEQIASSLQGLMPAELDELEAYARECAVLEHDPERKAALQTMLEDLGLR